MNETLRRAAALIYVEDLEAPQPSADQEHHLLNVLRLRPGERIVASDGAGTWRAFELAENRRPSGIRLEATDECQREVRPEPGVAVGFALQKGDRSEWTVQKLTELGVDRIVPLESERTIVRMNPTGASRRGDRLRRVAKEAAAQSRRVYLPVVEDPSALHDALAGAVGSYRVAFAEPGGADSLGAVTAIFIGPEGGWSPSEVALAPSLIDLGPLVLRAETAAIVAGTLLSRQRVAS